MENIYEVQTKNNRKSLLIIISFILFVSLSFYLIISAFNFYFGYQVGGLGIFGIALIVSGMSTFVSYYYSDKIVLGISGAIPADRNKHFNYYTAVENLCLASSLPIPRLYVIQDSATNAFATGRDPKHAVLCVTTGLLEKLNRSEIEGVVGHELTHIKNYDTRLMSIVTVMVGIIALLGDWLIRISWHGRSGDSKDRSSQVGALILIFGLIFAIISPIISQLIQLAISRRREFMADAGSVTLTRQPSGLISALKKISADTEPLEAANKATAHLYIENPFKDKTKSAVGWFSGLFNTHPPVMERIVQLQKMV